MDAGGTSAISKTKYENHFLRILSAVLIMFVVYIHYSPTIDAGDYNLVDLIHSIGRFAMPIFFLISGYFMFSEDGHVEKKIGSKAKHIFLLILYLKFFYLALDLLLFAFGYIGGENILFNFLVIGDSTAHYWFVASLLTVYIGHWYFQRKNIDFKYLIPLGIVFLAIDVIIGEFFPLFGIDQFFGMRTGDIAAGTYVFIGLFFFQAGYYMHKHKEWIDERFPTWKLAVIALFGLLLNIAEMFLILDTKIYEGTASVGPNIYIGTIILSLSLFMLTFRLKDDQLRCRPIEWLGRECSYWMYIYIGAGICLIQEVFLRDMADDFMMYDVAGPFIAIAIDVILALATYLLVKRLKSRS